MHIEILRELLNKVAPDIKHQVLERLLAPRKSPVFGASKNAEREVLQRLTREKLLGQGGEAIGLVFDAAWARLRA